MNQSNRLKLYTSSSSAKINFSKYHTKNYKHFDNKVSIENAVEKITNPCWVKGHGFYPFLHFSLKVSKYNNDMKGKEKFEPKERRLFYAAHIDSFIYKYYGDLLNEKYNKLALVRGIDELLKKKYKNKAKRKRITRLLGEKDFRRFRKSDINNIQFNKKDFGIPQGAGISSVCSNIYLLDFDEALKEYVKAYGGLYRRYCDDLIIVIPFQDDSVNYDYISHLNKIEEIKNQTPGLDIQKAKTKKYIYNQGKILDENLRPGILNYLGFAFDSHNVKLREKSLFKFYSRAYKRVRLCNWKSEESGVKKYRKSLYTNYAHLGNRKSGYGNFLTYAGRAQKIFDEDSTTNNLMEHQVKNHWGKIQRHLISPKPKEPIT
ncbi:MAG: reverse transcriptase domain-containing protein [Vulcanibacillus sp.]